MFFLILDVNYAEAFDKKYVMQGSCNVTGMGRILNPLKEKYADSLTRFDVTLVRRWADLEQTDKEITDTIEMTEQPHHGTDVKAFFGNDFHFLFEQLKFLQDKCICILWIYVSMKRHQL